MRTSPTLPCDAVIPELDAPRIRPTSDPPPGRVGAPAEVTLRLVQDHDRVAAGMNHIVVHWLFSAGLSLETALGLMGDHRAAAAVPAPRPVHRPLGAFCTAASSMSR